MLYLLKNLNIEKTSFLTNVHFKKEKTFNDKMPILLKNISAFQFKRKNKYLTHMIILHSRECIHNYPARDNQCHREYGW